MAAFKEPEVAQQCPLAILNKQAHVRMQVQRSRFTVHGSDRRSINDIVAGSDLVRKGLLRPIWVERESAELIANELKELGISQSTLFPDLEGVAIDLAREFDTSAPSGNA